MRLLLVAVAVFLLNLPFGHWRSRVRKFSWQWFAAIHLPVPLVVALRVLGGVGWRWWTFPVLITAYFAGQFLGARWERDGGRRVERGG